MARHGVPPLFNPSLWQRRATAEELVQGIEVRTMHIIFLASFTDDFPVIILGGFSSDSSV